MINLEKIINSLCIVCVAAIICGCTVRNMHSNSNLANISSSEQARAEIKIGMTMNEVSAKWGQPNAKQTYNDTINWNYVYQQSTLSGPLLTRTRDHKMVIISFNNGRVSKVSFQETQAPF